MRSKRFYWWFDKAVVALFIAVLVANAWWPWVGSLLFLALALALGQTRSVALSAKEQSRATFDLLKDLLNGQKEEQEDGQEERQEDAESSPFQEAKNV